jgi:hypothetical protein
MRAGAHGPAGVRLRAGLPPGEPALRVSRRRPPARRLLRQHATEHNACWPHKSDF